MLNSIPRVSRLLAATFAAATILTLLALVSLGAKLWLERQR